MKILNNDFEGSDYDSKKDRARLTGQMLRIYNCMIDGKKRTLQEIQKITIDPESSISAQLRNLRKKKWGTFVVEKQRRYNGGLWEYQLLPPVEENTNQIEIQYSKENSLTDKVDEALSTISKDYIYHYNNVNYSDNILIIKTDGTAMGRIYWFHDDNSVVYLNWLSVNEESRNKGLGLELQLIRENIGVVMGAKHFMLWVEKGSWMEGWYIRRGYEYHSKHKTEKGVVWMQKDIVQ